MCSVCMYSVESSGDEDEAGGSKLLTSGVSAFEHGCLMVADNSQIQLVAG